MEHEIRFLPSERRLRVPAGTSLLEAARQVGLPVASACGADGICARCGLRILAGADRIEAESDDESRVKEQNRVADELRLACRVSVRGDLVVTAPYW